MRPLLYVMGPPGSGKTTALRLALEGTPYEGREEPLRHMVYGSGAIQLGMDRETFGGTDALPMNVNPTAIQFLHETEAPALIAEGDRLANGPFFLAAVEAGWHLTIAYIHVSEQTAQARRKSRGTAQNEAWTAGRYTKVRNLAVEWKRCVWKIDGRRPPEDIAARLQTHRAVEIAREASG